MLSMAAPGAVFAAPTLAPTATSAPQRAPSIAGSPTAGVPLRPTPATPSPTTTATAQSTPTSTPEPTPTGTPTQTQTPAPDRQPAVELSPSPSPEVAADAPENSDAVEASVDWRAFVPTDVADHLATMDRAARESNCGVPWQLLAAIARVESDFGRNMATSSAGAIGYGQFLPSSWQAFGGAGNAYDYRDALPAIALYLCRSGLERDPRTALYAYNHADWYVDQVLDLAVRFDRLAPGAPTPDVLGVGLPQQDAAQMRYAAGRDVRQQSRARTVDGTVRWLGVPWRGRTPGQPIAPAALQTTTLSMLRQAEVGRAEVAAVSEAATSEDLGGFSNAAWDAGLLALPEDGSQWTLGELRQHLDRGQPVVVFVGSRGLPGHPPGDDRGEQPLVLIGSTADGIVYSDPSFSSSLGYGLQMSDADLLSAWDAAARPRQALAFVPRPKLPARQAHVAEAQAPEVLARVLATGTPAPVAAAPTVVPTAEPATPTDVLLATPLPVAAAPQPADAVVAQPSPPADWSWTVLVGVAAVGLGALALRLWRARRSA
jgi:membrane-bound lytic murein transglycosylase B